VPAMTIPGGTQCGEAGSAVMACSVGGRAETGSVHIGLGQNVGPSMSVGIM
jgi:hypothetical protein